MNTLAIDIGGTKFSMALYKEEQIARRITRPTDQRGGADGRPGRGDKGALRAARRARHDE